MTKQEALVQTALKEIGYVEGANNWNKYAEEVDKIPDWYNGPKQNCAWCGVFVDWCMIKTFGWEDAFYMLYREKGSLGAGCFYSFRYFINNGAYTSIPRIGQYIFFGTVEEPYHVGLVTAVDDEYVYTVEGNCSDGVRECQYKLKDKRIAGYGMPYWDAAVDFDNNCVTDKVQIAEPATVTVTVQPTTSKGVCKIELPELKYGSTGTVVSNLQVILDNYGYYLGKYGVDGDFGNDTKSAVQSFQIRHNLAVDGVVGQKTWGRLLRGD